MVVPVDRRDRVAVSSGPVAVGVVAVSVDPDVLLLYLYQFSNFVQVLPSIKQYSNRSVRTLTSQITGPMTSFPLLATELTRGETS